MLAVTSRRGTESNTEIKRERSLAEIWSNRSIRFAYSWLFLAALIDIVLRINLIVGREIEIGIDATRHLQLLGFATMLIFGVGSKMLPGFMGSRGIYSGKLVAVVFWLATLGDKKKKHV